MIGVFRHYVLQPGDPLDRRRLRELFFEATKRFTELDSLAIGNVQLGRLKFQLDAFEEYQTAIEGNIEYLVPEYGHLSPGISTQVVNDDPYFEGDVAWSADIEVNGAFQGKRIYGWPTVDGKALWAGESWSEMDQLLHYNPATTDPDETLSLYGMNNYDRFTLGSSCTVQGLNGRSPMGVLFASIGDFKISKMQINLRKQIR